MNLAPFRHQLVRETLRCENEYIETVSDMLDGRAVLPDSVKSVLRLLSQGNGDPGRMTRGKVGRCARDMVGDCRRCTKIVCRVCSKHPLHGCVQADQILELHDQASLPDSLKGPNPPSLSDLRHCAALPPSLQHTSQPDRNRTPRGDFNTEHTGEQCLQLR